MIGVLTRHRLIFFVLCLLMILLLIWLLIMHQNSGSVPMRGVFV